MNFLNQDQKKYELLYIIYIKTFIIDTLIFFAINLNHANLIILYYVLASSLLLLLLLKNIMYHL